jgi:flagellar basal body-associated protein FliL
MKKIIIIAAGAVVLLAGGIGGTVAIMSMGHKDATAAPAPPPPPKPPQFAELDNIVVSVPADTTDSTPAYVSLTLQFASPDPNAVTAFATFQPVIKAAVLDTLMAETAKSLMDPTTHPALTAKCLGIANQVLDKQGGYTPPDPFTAAYITSLVEQN